jgi:hypothetical protein
MADEKVTPSNPHERLTALEDAQKLIGEGFKRVHARLDRLEKALNTPKPAAEK